jgi:hypothetical protein
MEEEPLGYRVGIFFIVIGFMALIPFVASEQLNRPDYRYFFTGIFLIVLGGSLMWRNRPPKRQDVQRFRIFKRKPKEKRKE